MLKTKLNKRTFKTIFTCLSFQVEWAKSQQSNTSKHSPWNVLPKFTTTILYKCNCVCEFINGNQSSRKLEHPLNKFKVFPKCFFNTNCDIKVKIKIFWEFLFFYATYKISSKFWNFGTRAKSKGSRAVDPGSTFHEKTF